jgi:hypothetical protein
MNTTRFVFYIFLAAFLCTVGCVGLWHHPDPLAGWKPDFTSRPSDQAIERNYQDYIQQLPTKERNAVGPVFFFEDGTGQHAVAIEVSISGKEWRHVLIYDKLNKRIKAIKYLKGYYRS